MKPLVHALREARDFVFPLAEPLCSDQISFQNERIKESDEDFEARLRSIPDEKEDLLKEYLEEYSKKLDVEKGRQQSVDARLATMMGLSSIAATIVFGTVLAQAAGTLQVKMTSLRWILIAGAAYLTAQLSSAILAAVSGLSRRGYESERLVDLLPSQDESRPSYLRRRVYFSYSALLVDQRRGDEKVTQMAVAHRAMKNFLFGLLLFAFLGSFYGIAARTTHDGDEVLELLRKNHNLTEMLRGAQGPPGQPGPKGERGPRGAIGPRGKPCTAVELNED